MTNEFNHEPEDYHCPFCALLAGHEDNLANKEDVVYQNEFATAVIAPKWWINNPGHVLIVPNQHYENIYDIPEDLFVEIYRVAQKVAIAIRKTYDCEGTSTRQHNEPIGGQDVWHLHVHVFPRHKNDRLYENHAKTSFVDAAARAPYAKKLQTYFAENK